MEGKPKVLVTGGGGFIGSHIVEALVSSGHEVGVIDDFTTGDESNLRGVNGVRVHEGDVADRAFVKSVMGGYEAVIHQAARVSVPRSLEDPLETSRRNVNGTLSLLVEARDAGVERFIYASSSSVYGDTEELPKKESMPPRPQSPYAVSKLVAENYCKVFATVYGLRTVSLRYFNVYGPRQKPGPYGGVIPAFLRSALKGEPPTIFGDGSQTRDFTFVKDAVQANLLCLEKPLQGGEVFNVGSHSRTSLRQLAKLICAAVGREDLQPVYREPRRGDISHSYADVSRISKAGGYTPAFTIESGMAETVGWFRRNYASVQ